MNNLSENEKVLSREFGTGLTLGAWLETINSNSPRILDIRNDKKKAVMEFLEWFGKSPELTQPVDIKLWSQILLRKGLTIGTINNRLIAISSYLEFLRFKNNESAFAKVDEAKILKKYLPKNTRPLSEKELFDLLSVVKEHSLSGDVLFLRDYAILRLFVVTRRSRQEILGLECNQIKIKTNSIWINLKIKGGQFLSYELKDKISRRSLLNYLKSTGRNRDIFGKKLPLWLRHGAGANRLENSALKSHGFAKRMKIYAEEAGITNFHIQMLRHAYTSAITEDFISPADMQKISEKKKLKNPNFYIKKIKIVKDRFSSIIRRVIETEKKRTDCKK